jgi:MSHA biogenesis protein MshM
VALYLEHFGLREPPFRITPHTDFFFEGAGRGATLEALVYAVLHDEGIVKVCGEVGSGKTLLCRVLPERLPESVESLYLASPSLAQDEILQAIADELGLELPAGRAGLALRALQEELIRLYAAGRRVVLLIDEAHAMPEAALEQVRLLSNLETNRHKLLQIVLFAQPELDATLARESLRQLRDRVTHGFRLRPLTPPEVATYLSFRMRAAGCRGPEVFSRRGAGRLAHASHGLTRRINVLADKALLAAFTEGRRTVTGRHAAIAARDAELGPSARPRRPLGAIAAAAAAGVLIGVALQWARAPDARQAQERAVVPAAVPAREPEPVSSLSSEQAKHFEGYSAAGQRLLGERLAAARELLEAAPGERYSLELFMTGNTDPARMERFLIRARGLVPLTELYVIPVAGRDGYRLRVVYGQFASLEEALQAGRELPDRYQQAFRSAPRSIAELRRAN